MRRLLVLAITLIAVIATGPPAHADDTDKGKGKQMSLRRYAKLQREAITVEAYEQALQRLIEADVDLGIPAKEFLEMMGMFYVVNRKGEGVYGHCDGHLRDASREMTKDEDRDHYLVFGYYEDPKHKRGEVKKFYVVFRDDRLYDLAFFEAADIPDELSQKLDDLD